MQRPIGVNVIAVLFAVAALYLWTIGVILLIAPGAISLMTGKYFTYGGEIAGPYMILLVGSCYAVIAWGLFHLHNWARWLANADHGREPHTAHFEDLNGRARRAHSLVRIADRIARRGGMVSRASVFSALRLHTKTPRISTDSYG